MERRHEDELKLAIEALQDRGWVRIEWRKLYRWFNAKRLSRGAYTDLYGRIAEALDNKEPDIRFLSNDDHLFLIRGDLYRDYKEHFLG